MVAVLLAVLIIILLGGLGFAVHVLWWIAIAALVIFILGFLIRVGESAAGGGRRRRWYYW
ncbi:MAG: hydrophobic protein [Streptosporangiaceae bacterium]|nr:hydrophobic protein [Streptosporangiaceae bacterium]MBV9855976.1 hydrophobic protein [Streptosporangiaceae bacterium]